jgi:hypothetical protein
MAGSSVVDFATSLRERGRPTGGERKAARGSGRTRTDPSFSICLLTSFMLMKVVEARARKAKGDDDRENQDGLACAVGCCREWMRLGARICVTIVAVEGKRDVLVRPGGW